MALPPAFLDELRARTPLAPLIGRKARLARNGRQWKGCCPFHNEKTPSFYVYDDHFHCFGCGAHGDAIAFLMRAEGASFPEAVERLAAEAGMEVPKPSPQAAERERRARDLHGVLAAAEAAFRRRLHLPEGRAALDYLRRRGLTEETIARFGLGWSGEGRGALAADLKAEGIEPAQLIEAGLMKPRDPDAPAAGAVDLFFNRVMFPIRDRRGRTISFGGRILGEGQPKYVNGPETALFQKRRNLYGLDLAREGAFRGARVVVVEGYMDVIALHQAGFVGAVAPLGTALTTDQIDLLWQITPEPILCFDGDKAGLNALIRSSAVALPKLTHEKRVSVILLPLGEDPDTLLSKQGANSFARLLSGSSDFVGTLFRLSTEAANLNTPEGVAAWTRRHDEWVALIENPTMKKSYADFFRDARFKHLRAVRKSSEAVRRRERPERRIGDDTRHLRSERAPVPHRAVDTAGARIERARNLLAVLIRHPILLPEVEEPLAGLDLPEGRCAELRAAILQWLRTADALDSHLLLAQLAQSGLGESAHWATARAGLSPAAAPEAQPGEALDGFWHFFALLRGEEELMADRAEAERQLVATNDPAAQQRLIGLKRALDALRRGEVAEAEPGGVT